jgi:hypothetical protein
LDGNRKPLPGIQLSAVLDSKSPQPQSKPRAARTRRGTGEAPDEAAKVLRQTESRPDGIFFFLDCTDGKYMLTALDKHSGAQVEQAVSAAESAMEKDMKKRTQEEGYQIEIFLKMAT